MAGSFLRTAALYLMAFLLVHSQAGSHRVSAGTAVVDGSAHIAATDEDFICANLDWWPEEKCNYGSCPWGRTSILNLELNSILLKAIKAFSPLKLRLGGSLQDMVIYDTGNTEHHCRPFVENNNELWGFSEGCLSMSRWDQLNEFIQKAGAKYIFGLNALNGRVSMPDGSLGGPWNHANAASLIRYTANKGYNISGWELGNELSGKGWKARINAAQYASDVKTLKSVIEWIYMGHQFKPLVIAPGGNFEKNSYSQLIHETESSHSLDVVSHHLYILGPGSDKHLVEKILDPSFLDRNVSTFRDLRDILRHAGTSATAWVSESGGAYNSGRHLVTDAFVSSFWYVDQLGKASVYDTKTYCRQTLIGGNYGLLNTHTFKPNPDYYSALLWHRLMGQKVLSTDFIGSKMIRAYAHCARESKGLSIVFLNLGKTTTEQVEIQMKPADQVQGRETAEETREEYHLTANDGDLHSQDVLLNGKILLVDSYGNIPILEPIKVDASKPIYVHPLSIVFAHIPSIHPPACL